MRAFAASERSRGLGARSLARRLSAARSFIRWMSDRHGFDASRAGGAQPEIHPLAATPAGPRRRPRCAGHRRRNSPRAWIAARDTAVLTLLYGCGLRISEALALNGADWPLREALTIRGKGNRERQVPVLPIARQAIAAYLTLCPFPLEPQGPLFRGARGARLNATLIAAAMRHARQVMGLPPTATPRALRHSFATHLLAAGATCAASRNCWATPASRPPRSIPAWTTPG